MYLLYPRLNTYLIRLSSENSEDNFHDTDFKCFKERYLDDAFTMIFEIGFHLRSPDSMLRQKTSTSAHTKKARALDSTLTQDKFKFSDLY